MRRWFNLNKAGKMLKMTRYSSIKHEGLKENKLTASPSTVNIELKEKVDALVDGFKEQFKDHRLDRMYFPFEQKEVKRDGDKIEILKKIYRFDVKKIIQQEIGNDITKAVAFIKYRNFMLTEEEQAIV